MKILAFDSSAKSASVAILEDDILVDSCFQNEGLTHSKTVLHMYETINEKNNLKPSDIDVIAVTVGPGSYTGVRIGVAVAQGLALALDKYCVGVSSLEAISYNETKDGLVVCVMDARRDEVYNASFLKKDGNVTRLCEDRCISISNLNEELAGKEFTLVGDASHKCAELFENVKFEVASNIYCDALSVAKLALTKPTIHVSKLIPVYLKLSKAERNV